MNNPQELACFHAVESILGHDKAIEELSKVIVLNHELIGLQADCELVGGAFIWCRTPQRHQFWENIAINSGKLV